MHRLRTHILMLLSITAISIYAQHGQPSCINPVTGSIVPGIETLTVPEPLVADGMMVPIPGWRPNVLPDTTPSPNDRVPGNIPYTATTTTTTGGDVSVTIPIKSFASEFESNPNISLNYLSSAGVGALGKGWYISGLSTISRTRKNYFTDGNTSGIRRDSTDVFELDGVRLVFIKTDSVGHRWYQTQTGNVRVRIGGGIVAMYPDGRVAEYGIHDETRFHMTKLTYPDGRIIEYQYGRLQNVNTERFQIYKISYGDNRTMAFHYKAIGDNNRYLRQSEGGMRFSLYEQLDSITVSYHGNRLCRYALDYNLGDGTVNRIENPPLEITLHDASGNSYLPLHLSYCSNYEATPKDTIRLNRHFKDTDLDHFIVSRGRFDPSSENDGILMYANRDSYCVNSGKIVSDYTVNDTIIATTVMGSASNHIPCDAISAGRGFVGALAMEVDSVKGEELVRLNNMIENDSDKLYVQTYQYVFDINTNSNYSFSPRDIFTITDTLLNNNNNPTLRPKSFYTGDFDGDGREELLVVGHSCPQSSNRTGYVKLIDVENRLVKLNATLDSCYWQCPAKGANATQRQAAFNASDRTVVMDYDGDGKLELGIVNERGINICSFAFDGSGEVYMTKILADTSLRVGSLSSCDLLSADFDGDHCSDLMRISRGTSQQGYVYYDLFIGNGAGGFVYPSWYGSSFNSNVGVLKGYTLADYDRNGAADLILQGDNYTRAITFRNEIKDTTLIIGNSSAGKFFGASSYSGSLRGTCGVASIDAQGLVTFYSYISPYDVRHSLIGISDSYGSKHTFTYARLVRSADLPIQLYDYRFPFATCAEGRLVCVEHSYGSAGTAVKHDEYITYNTPVVHRQGLGFMGFEGVNMIDSEAEQHRYSSFNPLNFGVPVHVQTGYDEDFYNHAVTIDSMKRIKTLLMTRMHQDLATGIADTTTYSYDSYGNMTHAVTVFPGNNQIEVSNTYCNNVSDSYNIVGLPEREVRTVTRNGMSGTTGKVITYNHFLPLTITDYHGSEQNKVKTVSFNYDDTYRVTKVSVKPYSGTPLNTRYRYSGSMRRPSSIVDSRGVTTTLDYGGFGVTHSRELSLVISDDPLHNGQDGIDGADGRDHITPGGGITPLPGIDTYYHYDSFGRLDSVNYPQGSVTTRHLRWAAQSEPGVVVEETATSGTPSQRTHLDAAGLTVRTAVLRPDSAWLKTDFTYDTRGRLVSETLPFKSMPEGSTTSQYDSFDRILSRTYPDGHADTYSYSGLTVTSLIDGMQKTATVDALGGLVEVTDPGGSIEYDLRPDGQPLSITVNGNIETRFEYDTYGRQTALIDPSAGRRERTYDSAGNIATETDARGRVISSTYNKHGKPLTRIFDEGLITVYDYNNFGLLTGMEDSEGKEMSWTYDNCHRLTCETIDGFVKQFGYGSDGSLMKTVYRLNGDSITAEHYTRSNGTLVEVRLGGTTPIWRLDDENDRGLPVSIGNSAMSSHFTYDLAGRVTDRVVERTLGGDFVQNLTYGYIPATGNMSFRRDNLFAQTDTFSYDGLNRLTSLQNSYAVNRNTYSYSSNGNLKVRQPSVMVTWYSSQHPYALAQAAVTGFVPDRNQQVGYNVMQLPDSIVEGGYSADFTYWGDRSRATMTVTDTLSCSEVHRYYDQRLNEIVRQSATGTMVGTKRILYLAGSPYKSPAALVDSGGGWKLHYIVRDNLGSITAVTDSAGNVLQRLSYDPWGTLRDPVTLVPFAPGDEPHLLLSRGYTGHEHLPWFGLVNMNARLYDPATGRFLNPDPFVQDPTCTQSFNRYSYCLNNPLRYSDPTGRDILYITDGGIIVYREYSSTIEWNYLLSGVTCTPEYSKPDFAVNHEMHQMFRPLNNDVVIWSDGFNYYDSNSLSGGGPLGGSAAGNRVTGQTDNSPLSSRNISITVSTVNTAPTVVDEMWDYAVRDKLGMNSTQKVTAADYEKAFDKDMAKFSKGVRILNRSLMIADGLCTAYDAISDGINGKPIKGATKAGVSIVIYSTMAIPVVGPFISIGLGIANAIWGDELIYDNIDY